MIQSKLATRQRRPATPREGLYRLNMSLLKGKPYEANRYRLLAYQPQREPLLFQIINQEVVQELGTMGRRVSLPSIELGLRHRNLCLRILPLLKPWDRVKAIRLARAGRSSDLAVHSVICRRPHDHRRISHGLCLSPLALLVSCLPRQSLGLAPVVQ